MTVAVLSLRGTQMLDRIHMDTIQDNIRCTQYKSHEYKLVPDENSHISNGQMDILKVNLRSCDNSSGMIVDICEATL